MPTTLLIISDMQFHPYSVKSEKTVVNASLGKWRDAGYKIPKIIYWNTAGYAGSPETVKGTNIALVSGFNTAILKAIFSGVDFSPRSIMERAIEKYEIRIP